MGDKKGFVALVGAGPGAPGLLTLRGKELLESADTVVYDRLVSKEILCMAKNAKLIDVGKSSGNHKVKQEEINEILVQAAQNGGLIVRLKGGDPFLFGRGGEELEALALAGVEYEEVPGITSAIGVPALAGIPVTHRKLAGSLHIFTGHKKDNQPLNLNFHAIAQLEGTLVFLMGVSALKDISEGLIEAGISPKIPAAIIENGGRPNQRKVTAPLNELYSLSIERKIGSPAVIVVGEVCSFSETFDWFSRRPLFGVKVAVTRPANEENALRNPLKNLGAEVFECPSFTIKPQLDIDIFCKAFEKISSFSWVVFTSKNGVDIFFDRLMEEGKDCRFLGHLKVAAVGRATEKALKARGIISDYVPDSYGGTALGEGLVERTGPDDKLLLIRALNGDSSLLERLDFACREYQILPAYETIVGAELHFLKSLEEQVDLSEKLYVTFTSASTVEGFAKNASPKLLSEITGICIGPSTAEKARNYGIKHVISDEATFESMIEKILETAGKGAGKLWI